MACWVAPWLNVTVTRRSAGVQAAGAARAEEEQPASARAARAAAGGAARTRPASARTCLETHDGRVRLDAPLVITGIAT